MNGRQNETDETTAILLAVRSGVQNIKADLEAIALTYEEQGSGMPLVDAVRRIDRRHFDLWWAQQGFPLSMQQACWEAWRASKKV